VTASEFAFLSFGLVLGVVGGAALVEVLRSRPAPPREIRLTVTPDIVPRRRSATLAEDAFVVPVHAPASHGPADRRQTDRAPAGRLGDRTSVLSILPPAGAGDHTSGLPLSRLVTTRPALGLGEPHARTARAPLGRSLDGAMAVAVPIHLEPDPQLAALRAVAARSADRAIQEQGAAEAALLERASARTAVADPPAAGGPAVAWSGPHETAATDAAAAEPSAADCVEASRVTEERCAVAGLARRQADSAADALRGAQRAYDQHMSRAEQAGTTADLRGIRAAKERAQHTFRDARATAGQRDGAETAARDWLNEINRINRAAREAAATLLHEREAAHALVTTIERLTVEGDVARVAAESAETACVDSRQAAADCVEAAPTDQSPKAGWPPAPSAGVGGGLGGLVEDETELEAAFTATGAGEPAILRLLRGDRDTLGRLVGELAGADQAERRRWQLALAGLVDAVVARAIEASFLTFPTEHSFWGMFTLEQNRNVAAALSSLGYRFDGLGGWADDRVPGARDMSLAVGYAGLDPMRTRHWPRERGMTELFRDVSVAADEYLADAAGGLTLGELVSVLGRRADALADLWNDWGRVRPLLLSGG